MQELLVAAPGRVNLIGEHIDYHGLAVLPMALRRRIQVTFHRRDDRRIRATSAPYGSREFEWIANLAPVATGDWENYLRAAAQAIGRKWGVMQGVEAVVTSNLPAAAGLSSSSALLVAFTLALLEANGCAAGFEELMEILPDGEQFVGTRGGGMDHAASLASREGCASLIEFAPVSVRHIPVPDDWRFLVAHSLVTAEKSGPVREAYNHRRKAGTAALAQLGLDSYCAALGAEAQAVTRLDPGLERDSFFHVTSEALRVQAAVQAMECDDPIRFGALLLESHASLRDRLRVSCPALDRLVEAAMESGALGARLTGAGFGGCAVILCRRPDAARVRSGIIERFYAARPEFDEPRHLIDAIPGAGALRIETK
ncbi:MAG TPA: galactokinase family protein [Bryobacteraceae bacterium]|nr:galactokinase family protein [Bryobacteraceae bacterium]